MFTVKSIQAEYGDSLLISYGASQKSIRHILVDGGTADALPNLFAVLDETRNKQQLRLEALIVTHYDLDHIGGVIALLNDLPSWLTIGDVWFNGRKHLSQKDKLGPAEGDSLSKQIDGHHPWNDAFNGGPIRSDAAPIFLAGGLTAWILSPDHAHLSKLATKWPGSDEKVETPADKLGAKDFWPPGEFAVVASRKFEKDSSVANGSSIAVMFGFEDKLVLLTGDAHPDVVTNGLSTHWPSDRPVVSLLKLSHHGSKANTNEALLKALECKRFLISTNGDNYQHPDVTMLARVLKIKANPTFLFNYALERTLWWSEVPEDWPPFDSLYPEPGAAFIQIDI